MSEKAFPMRKIAPLIIITWIMSLITTLVIVSVVPSFYPVRSKDGLVTSTGILDGTLTAVDYADGSIITIKIADGVVTASKIADGAIVTVKLANASVTSMKILDGTITATDLATGSVTNVKLGSQAIPFGSTYSTSESATTSTSWDDASGLGVRITLTRTSHLIIIFSAEARGSWSGSIGPAPRLQVRAMVGEDIASPDQITLMSSSEGNLPYNSHGCTFYRPNVSSGEYFVKIQLRVSGQLFYVGARTLTVLALPV